MNVNQKRQKVSEEKKCEEEEAVMCPKPLNVSGAGLVCGQAPPLPGIYQAFERGCLHAEGQRCCVVQN